MEDKSAFWKQERVGDAKTVPESVRTDSEAKKSLLCLGNSAKFANSVSRLCSGRAVENEVGCVWRRRGSFISYYGGKVLLPSFTCPKALNVMAGRNGTSPAPLLTVTEIW